MVAPTRPFVVDPVLTAISIGFRNTAMMKIADQVLPRFGVSAEKFKWTTYPMSEAFNTPDARVGRLGQVNQVIFSGTEETASVDDFGLDTPIPYSDIEAAAAARAQGRSTYDPEAHSAQMLTDTIENIREARVAGTVFNLATYAADKRITLSGTSQFSDYANSDPISVIKTGMLATTILTPNTMVMGREVWAKLSSQPVDRGVTVLFTLPVADGTGAARRDQLEGLINDTIAAVAGWGPGSTPHVFRLVRGAMLSMQGGTIAYQIDFAIGDQLRISP